MKKRIISKKIIKVGKKHYTEEKYWPLFPSDRIITARTRKIIIPQWMSVVLLTLVLLALFSIGKFIG
jgi:hypothetical protein|tara:strand:+ start:240 stop:440 length:201 start_codon:yes stop_codon:yes gene_type:complete